MLTLKHIKIPFYVSLKKFGNKFFFVQVEQLLEDSVDSDILAVDSAGESLLMHAVSGGDTAVEIILEIYIAAGGDIDARSNAGISALVFAVQHNQIGIVNKLIEGGASLELNKILTNHLYRHLPSIFIVFCYSSSKMKLNLD